VASRLLGRYLAGGRWRVFLVVPLTILLPLVWPATVCCAALVAQEGISRTLGGQESPYFQEPFVVLKVGTLLLVPVTLLGGALLTARAFGARSAAQCCN
jgi:hypothetical protein